VIRVAFPSLGVRGGGELQAKHSRTSTKDVVRDEEEGEEVVQMVSSIPEIEKGSLDSHVL